MSTVLWANVSINGQVKSEQADYSALYKQAGKLDSLTRRLKLPAFQSICDTTDQRYNLEDKPLPDDMLSTDQLMAIEGVWLPISSAIAMLQALRGHIVENKTRFGLFANQHDQVVAELADVIAFASAEASIADRFNFSVVT